MGLLHVGFNWAAPLPPDPLRGSDSPSVRPSQVSQEASCPTKQKPLRGLGPTVVAFLKPPKTRGEQGELNLHDLCQMSKPGTWWLGWQSP